MTRWPWRDAPIDVDRLDRVGVLEDEVGIPLGQRGDGLRGAVGLPEFVGELLVKSHGLQIDRVLASGARFGGVLADAEYGKAALFRAGLGERQLAFAVGILPTQKVYPADVKLAVPERKATGRPRKHPCLRLRAWARPS